MSMHTCMIETLAALPSQASSKSGGCRSAAGDLNGTSVDDEVIAALALGRGQTASLRIHTYSGLQMHLFDS